MTIEVGKTYNVNHSRKGKFALQVTSVSEEWIDGFIVSGMAKAILPYNEVYEGEKITVRRSFCTFTPTEKVA